MSVPHLKAVLAIHVSTRCERQLQAVGVKLSSGPFVVVKLRIVQSEEGRAVY